MVTLEPEILPAQATSSWTFSRCSSCCWTAVERRTVDAEEEEGGNRPRRRKDAADCWTLLLPLLLLPLRPITTAAMGRITPRRHRQLASTIWSRSGSPALPIQVCFHVVNVTRLLHLIVYYTTCCALLQTVNFIQQNSHTKPHKTINSDTVVKS